MHRRLLPLQAHDYFDTCLVRTLAIHVVDMMDRILSACFAH